MSLSVVIAAALVQMSLAQMPGVCGSIGVRVRPITAAVADSLGMPAPYGAIFGRPARGGPAAQAKIEAGDVVVKINGSPLGDWRDFAPTIANMAPGTTVYLTTWRNRELIDVSVTLGYGKCPSRVPLDHDQTG